MYKTILHATDLQENHYEICKKAVEIARSFKATLHLLHVIETPATLQLAQGLGFAELITPVTDDARTVLSVLGDALGIPATQQHIEVGSVKLQVLKTLRELSANLLIIGSHDPANHLPAFLGSTAHAVVNHAPCDVLTLRL